MQANGLLVAASFVCLSAVPAFAADNTATGRVTACSKNGHFTCESAVVSESRVGPKLRLKHGTLIDCQGDCRDTLRRATVDYWDDRRENY